LTTLQLTLGDLSGRASNAVVWAEVANHPTPTEVHHVPVTVGQTTDVQLAPGTYLVRVVLPSGQALTGRVEVPNVASVALNLQARPSPHEWLGWAAFVGEIPSTRDYQEVLNLVPSPAVWHRLWRRGGKGWTAEQWPDSWVDSDGRMWGYRFASRPYWLRILELGGSEAAWRYTVLPPVDWTEVTIRPGGDESLTERGAQVMVAGNDHAADGLVRYLTAGLLEPAAVVVDELLRRRDPVQATQQSDLLTQTAVAYYLIEARRWERLQPMALELQRLAPWLPDAAVVRGMAALGAAGSGDLSEAARWLVDATAYGVPAVTVGLFQLRDALERLLHSMSVEELQRTGVQRAHERVAPYAEASDWTKPYTTFYGTAPDRPDLASRTGVPMDWEGIEFLAEGTTPFAASFPPPGPGMGRRATYRVAHTAAGWTLESLDATTPGQTFTNKDAAVARAAWLMGPRPGRVVIYHPDGVAEHRLVEPAQEPG
jgi:hypothetical protein